MNIKTVKRLYHSGSKGTECKFIKLSEKIGAKVYHRYTKDRVRKIYNQQKRASLYGLGPEVHGEFSITYKNVILHGYFTEIVDIISPRETDEGLYPSRYFNFEEQKDLQKLITKLLKINISEGTIGDLYELNIGWKNKKMVCIDFGFMDM